jgi:hypothetical protein
MPAELWAAAVAVARKRGLYKTARGAGIDYGSLAKRLRDAPPGDEAGSLAKVEFVEWSGVELLGQVAKPAGTVVEMADPSGRHVTVHLGGGEPVDIAGTVFVFRSRSGTSVKLLVYDGQGFWLCQKRLSRGRFPFWPTAGSATGTPLQAHELQVLLCGGDPSSMRAAPQWRPVLVPA